MDSQIPPGGHLKIRGLMRMTGEGKLFFRLRPRIYHWQPQPRLEWLPTAGMLVAAATVVVADEPRASRLPISFTVEKPGHVSAAVYAADGRLVRDLLHAAPMSAGKQSLIWDGLDRDGQTLRAGEYSWKLLQTPGMTRTTQRHGGMSGKVGRDGNAINGDQ